MNPTPPTAVGEASQPEIDWNEHPLAELVDHLEKTHHAYLHEKLPMLTEISETVAHVHGETHPELFEVRKVFVKFMSEMVPHLKKEELVLFPGIVRLEREGDMAPLWQPIAVMEADHDEAERDLAQLRKLTRDYFVPEDACAAYRMLMEGLAEMEHDTIVHLEKENSYLFPRVLKKLGK